MLRQPPVLSTVSISTFAAALLVEVNLAECGVKIVISMPASCSTDFIHLARVSLKADLYGFDVVINKQVMLPLSDLVTSLYCLNSFTGQTLHFHFSHMELNTSSFKFIACSYNKKISIMSIM